MCGIGEQYEQLHSKRSIESNLAIVTIEHRLLDKFERAISIDRLPTSADRLHKLKNCLGISQPSQHSHSLI